MSELVDRRVPVSPISLWLTVICGGMFCLALIFLALPRLGASIELLYPEQSSDILNKKGEQPNLSYLLKNQLYIEAAQQWHVGSKAHELLAFNQMQQMRWVPPQALNELLQSSYEHNSKALAQAPINPYVWYRQALLEFDLPAFDRLFALNSLRLSCLSARVQPELLIPRSQLFLRYEDALNEDLQELFEEQLRLAIMFKKGDMIKFAYVHPDVLYRLERALQNTPELWQNFLRKLEKYTQKIQTTTSKKASRA